MRLALLLPLLALAGCSGVPAVALPIRQDKDDREAATKLLAEARTGRPFPAARLLDRRFARLWAFRGGSRTQPIEDRIGVPFPQSGLETPGDAAYLVFDDGKVVLSAFSPQVVDSRCLLADRTPLTPSTPLVVLPPTGSGPVRVATAAGAARCR